ncbi:DUF2240 family protein [Halosegnis sp.]|uniref:DUF2240 family protein n=1 Tax=Halosegnis sp. TaxID=2864959 RepID=UPI0035D3E222
MSLRVAVAAPFRAAGDRRLAESSFVVALSLDRDWFSPDQAKRLVDVAASEGLLNREGEELVVSFNPEEVTVPDDFRPDESLLRERSTFERVLDACTDAGIDKQTAVAGINELQAEFAVTVEAAAIVFARRQGLDVDDAAADVLEEL